MPPPLPQKYYNTTPGDQLVRGGPSHPSNLALSLSFSHTHTRAVQSGGFSGLQKRRFADISAWIKDRSLELKCNVGSRQLIKEKSATIARYRRSNQRALQTSNKTSRTKRAWFCVEDPPLGSPRVLRKQAFYCARFAELKV